MKLFPNQEPLDIYQTGFGSGDMLNRAVAGKQISELLERVEDSVVLALDGPWGSGKSYFLKRWVGAHSLENNGRATTIYFDSFKNDFLDDPLVSLIGAIGERLPANNKDGSWETIKKYGAILAKPVLRIGLAAATSGVSELAGPMIDATAGKVREEIEDAADVFWKKEDGRKAAMLKFQSALTQLTEPSAPDLEDGRPLIIVIDELDRCRPDYALSTLEVIKHFFAAPNVHFILGVNVKALEHMVRSRYGHGINATDYLKRFISLTMRLPDFIDDNQSNHAALIYFSTSAKNMGISRHNVDLFNYQLKLICEHRKVSLRDIEKILTRIVLLPNSNRLNEIHAGYQIIIASLIILEVLDNDLYENAVSNKITIDMIRGIYGISNSMIHYGTQNKTYNHDAYILNGTWKYIITGAVDEDKSFASSFDQHQSAQPQRIMKAILNRYLSKISLDP